MRIQNFEQLTGHGNAAGREHALRILGAGLDQVDPYIGVKNLVSRDGDSLVSYTIFEQSPFCVGSFLFRRDGRLVLRKRK